jgi:putative endonuclease
MKQPAVYILASQKNGTLYIGVTSNLRERIWQHKNHVADGFTKKYGINTLVYFEQAETMASAIYREKQMKKLSRNSKVTLIEIGNPDWKDLYEGLL